MTNNNLIPMASLIVAITLNTLYCYINICYSSFLILNAEPNWNTQNQNNYTSCHIIALILTTANLAGIILCTTLNNIT